MSKTRFLSAAVAVLCVAFSSVAAAGEDLKGARVENFEGAPFGRAVKLNGAGPNSMALHISGNILYIGGDNSLLTADISDAMNPKILGRVGGLGNVRQIAVQGGIAYVAARESGLWIIDARNPSKPKVLSRYDCVELATGVEVAGDVVFLGQRQNGVEFIDVSDPARPEHIGILKTPESQSVKYRDGLLFSGEWGKGEVTLIDARDMADIKVVSVLKLDGYGDGLDFRGNLLFASTGHHSKSPGKTAQERFGRGHGLEIFDISNISNIRKVSSVKFPKCYNIGNDFWTPRCGGNVVFAADTHNGLYAVDVKNPERPRVVGRIVTPDKSGKYLSAPVSSVAVADGVVYVSSMHYGVLAVECPGAKPGGERKSVLPKNVSHRADYPTDESKFFVYKPERSVQVRGAAVDGNVAYAACGSEGVAILELSEGGFKKIGEMKIPFAGDVKVKGGRLYVAEGMDGLAVYNIDAPAKLTEAGRLKNLSETSSLVLWVWTPDGKFIAASDRQGGIFFIDARDLKNMKVVFRKGGCPGWDKFFSGDVVGGRYAAMSYANSRFEWFDLSGEIPASANVSYKNNPSLYNGCCALKGKILFTMRDGSYVLLEPNQPENADGTPWKGRRLGGEYLSAIPACNGGNIVSFTNRIRRQVLLADFSDVENPKILWKERISGNPDPPAFWGDKPIIPAGFQGLLMAK